MIRQTTKIPVVSPPSPDHESDGAGPQAWWFVVAEIVLLAAIPVLGFLGVRALLDTRSGAFVVDPGPEDPGWVAVVDPTPVTLLIDLDEGRVGGAVLLVAAGEAEAGGTVILISGATEIDGQAFADRTPLAAAAALEDVLRIEVGEPTLLDSSTWDALLAGVPVELANPDPVVGLDDSSEVLVPAGRVLVEPLELAAVSVRPSVVTADPEALEFRRAVLWRTLLDEAVFISSSIEDPALLEVAARLEQIAGGVHRVEQLPLDGAAPDIEAVEDLLRSAIVLPRGHEVGARLAVRIVDRSGFNDLEGAARRLGREGFEVVQIANASTFDDGPTQLVSSVGAPEDELARLADLTGAATVPPSIDAESSSVVTLILGADAVFAPSSE